VISADAVNRLIDIYGADDSDRTIRLRIGEKIKYIYGQRISHSIWRSRGTEAKLLGIMSIVTVILENHQFSVYISIPTRAFNCLICPRRSRPLLNRAPSAGP
jgi:Tfp pilus assembly pilus retraction ATPase PilT